MLKEAGHIKNKIVFIFRYIQCLLMYSKVAWVLLSSRTQVQPQVILDPASLPNYPSVSYGYGLTSYIYISSHQKCSIKKAILKKFRIITGKQLWDCNFIKKRFYRRSFLVGLATFLRTPILKNIC